MRLSLLSSPIDAFFSDSPRLDPISPLTVQCFCTPRRGDINAHSNNVHESASEFGQAL